jgi:hypothetical protein
MRPHDRAVDHGVLIVRIAGQHLKQLLPHAALDAVDGSSTGT